MYVINSLGERRLQTGYALFVVVFFKLPNTEVKVLKYYILKSVFYFILLN